MILNYISSILLLIAMAYIGFGLIGIFRYDDVYSKLLTSSQIDTVAAITTIIALILRTGFSTMTIKLILILAFVLTTGPVSSNHIIAKSAYYRGYNPNKAVNKR